MLVSPQHVTKVSQLTLESVSVATIFDAETFCKRFVSKLPNIEHLVIKRCQPMFLEKFFMIVAGDDNL